jgi:hypothetical protein
VRYTRTWLSTCLLNILLRIQFTYSLPLIGSLSLDLAIQVLYKPSISLSCHFSPWRWKQHFSPKLHRPANPHGAKPQDFYKTFANYVFISKQETTFYKKQARGKLLFKADVIPNIQFHFPDSYDFTKIYSNYKSLWIGKWYHLRQLIASLRHPIVGNSELPPSHLVMGKERFSIGFMTA